MSIFKFLEQKKNLINSLLIYYLAGSSALSIVFWNISLADKACLASGVVVLVALFALNFKAIKKWQICLALLNALSLAVTCIIHKGEGLGVILTAFYLIMSLIIYNSVSFDRKAIDTARYIICGAIMILFIISKYRQSQTGNWIFIYDRFGNMINNNSICILIVSLIFLLVILLKSYYESNEISSLVIVSAIVAVGIFLVLPFGGRISIAAIVLFLVFILLRKYKISSSVYKKMCIGMFILALLIPIMYIYLHNIIGDFNFMGKTFFSGRELVWRSAFNQISEYPIFGSGTVFSMESSGETQTQSTHNAMLGLWKGTGIIPLISVVVCLFNVRYKYIKLEDRAILALLVIMFTESFFMDSHFCFTFVLFMLRSHDEIESDLPESKLQAWVNKIKRKERKAQNDT